MSELTQKKEMFAQRVAEGMNQSDAYRAAYDVGVNTKTDTVNQAASRLMSDSKIKARVEELRKPIVVKVGITLENHLARLQELSDKAEEAGQYSAAIKAEESRGKACGLYTDKVELTGKDGGDIGVKQTVIVNLVKAK